MGKELNKLRKKDEDFWIKRIRPIGFDEAIAKGKNKSEDNEQ